MKRKIKNLKSEIEVSRTEKARKILFLTLFSAWKKSLICLFCIVSMPVLAQNMASIEAPMGYPMGVSFAYGFDFHPKQYIQIKPNMTTTLSGGNIQSVIYGLAIEHRYYYNSVKRQLNGRNTLHKSADFFSLKPSWSYMSNKDKNELYPTNQIFYCPINWGLRRALGERFYLDGSIGVGPLYNKNENAWFLQGNFYLSIGVRLF